MRVLHILDHSLPLHSGYSFRTLSILREQQRLGWETQSLTSPRQGAVVAKEECIEGQVFHRTAPLSWTHDLPLIAHLAAMRATERRLDALVRRLKPDLLHAHSPVLNAIPALAVGRRLGVPTVYEIRAFWEDAAVDHGTQRAWGWRYRASRALESWAVQRADQVVTICEGLRAELIERGLAPGKVAVVPNAVDAERFCQGAAPNAALRERLGLGEGPVLGFIGSFYAYEGLDLLIEALPRIRARLPEARLLLVGGGPQEGALRAQARALGLEEAVRCVGRIAQQDIGAYYDLIDLLVYPRRPMRLTDLVTPLKPLEAMAQGRLFIASDVGGHRELIRAGDTGLLFSAGDVGALAECALEALALPDGGARLRTKARAFIERERTWPQSVARYAGVYARALGRAPGD
ncbi:MAG: glycosyltransferase, exosortase A system-associated [Chromatiaceae bacterium]|nr:glycosyltransferase, exosortase A system-associated [Chromatiaceae bacterium]